MEDTAMLQTPTKIPVSNPVVQTPTKSQVSSPVVQTPPESQVSNPVARFGEINDAFGAPQGRVFGGVSHGRFQNDFDWKQLATWTQPRCGRVCRDPRRGNQCFPVKWNDHYGPPCGVVQWGNGCFQNVPTQTCALCNYPEQPYCCPYEQVPICGFGLVREIGQDGPYGGVQGGVFGGFEHGKYENDFNFNQLNTWRFPQCEQVCRSPRRWNQCYPVKQSGPESGNYGPPCGNVNLGNGCFQNAPTQTCALCNYPAQPYCCPFWRIPICQEW